jgi:hypothetical protein
LIAHRSASSQQKDSIPTFILSESAAADESKNLRLLLPLPFRHILTMQGMSAKSNFRVGDKNEAAGAAVAAAVAGE